VNVESKPFFFAHIQSCVRDRLYIITGIKEEGGKQANEYDAMRRRMTRRWIATIMASLKRENESMR